MNLTVCSTINAANAAATDLLAQWLKEPGVRNVMVAGGNTPLDLYGRVAERRLTLSHLTAFALDEYVGVPMEEPRNCANLLRRTVADAWGIPADRFFTVSSLESDALASVQAHERRIDEQGGLDVLVLGLGQNGHLGFNEPGSAADSTGRVLDLDSNSIEANRKWFSGDYAPAKGVTVGLKTILAARQVLILAFGAHKTAAVKRMVNGPVFADCPASFLQHHPATHVILDEAAASALKQAGIGLRV
jgi:glucosamine-6-phosphate deaminase